MKGSRTWRERSDSPDLRSSPATSFGIGKRGIDHNNDIPGPGTYSASNLTRQGLSYSLGGKRVNQTEPIVPGPGAYDSHNAIGEGVKISLRGRLKYGGDNDGPGPG